MRIHGADTIGIDVLVEISSMYFLTEQLDTSGYYVAYKDDGVTPVNVVDSHAWLDDYKKIVRRADYVDSSTQIPLPIVSFDMLSDVPEALEIGSNQHRKIYTMSLLVHAENKVQLINQASFLEALLVSVPIPILNYNVTNNPQIGVINCRDMFKTRLYNIFQETNLASKHAISITCSAEAEFDNNYAIG